MNNYQPVIGLEVHIELNTKSKMFSRSSADYFGKNPNTQTDSTSLGLPGALPFINQAAIDNCIKIGLALNCSISEVSRFERKNYFYPDLPKGYQISQYRWPLCVNGWLEVEGEDGKKIKVRINRVHQEEDTGKLFHLGGQTLIDFNRSGVPLVEIVTEPDFHHSSQVKDFAKKLQQLFRYLEVSGADMEKGEMRLEANVSVRVKGNELPSYRVELKNINSFRFMEAAINYEVQRQIGVLESGGKLEQETRGWNEAKKETYVQRTKEEAHDYRYFPEPDLPELRITESRIGNLRLGLPELPWEKVKRFISDYGISKNSAEILTQTKELADYFEKAAKEGKKEKVDSQEVANYIVNRKKDIVVEVPTQKLKFKLSPPGVIKEIMKKRTGIISDVGELEKLAKEAIKENPESAKSYKKGKSGALNVLLGAVMRKTGGKADMGKVKQILEKLLQ